MKMRELARRAVAIAASAAMALALTPAATASAAGVAAGTATEGGFTYKVNSDGTATVTDYADKAATEVTVPAELGGHVVTCVDPLLFSQGEAESVTLPSSLICVGWAHKMANGGVSYEQSGFVGAEYLEKISVEAASEHLAAIDGVLYTADMKTLICYPGAAREDDTTLSMPEGVAGFSRNPFYCAPYLTALKFPASFAIDGDLNNHLQSCAALAEISVAEDNRTFCSDNGVLYSKDKTTLIAYPREKPDRQFAIPASVSTLRYRALSNQKCLHKVTIGPSVTDMSACFTGCRELQTIEIAKGNNNFAIKGGVLYTKSLDTLLAYPAGKGAERFEIPGSVTTVGVDAFRLCKISSLVVPASVKEMQSSCFYSETIKTIYAATSTQYDKLLAEDIHSATSVYLSEAKTGVVEASVEKVPKEGETVSVAASTGKVRFTVLSISAGKAAKGATAMARKAKSYTGAVRVDYYPTGRDGKVNLKAIRLCGASGKFDVRLNVTEVAAGSFKGRRDVKDVALVNVAKLGASSFSGCRNLKATSLGGGLASIGAFAFQGCRALKSVRIASAKLKAGKVGSAAFKGTPKKMAVKAPKTKLGSYKKLLRKAGASPSARFARI